MKWIRSRLWIVIDCPCTTLSLLGKMLACQWTVDHWYLMDHSITFGQGPPLSVDYSITFGQYPWLSVDHSYHVWARPLIVHDPLLSRLGKVLGCQWITWPCLDMVLGCNWTTRSRLDKVLDCPWTDHSITFGQGPR